MIRCSRKLACRRNSNCCNRRTDNRLSTRMDTPKKLRNPIRIRPARVVAVVRIRSIAVIIARATIVRITAVIISPAILADPVRARASVAGHCIVTAVGRTRPHCILPILMIAIARRHLRGVRRHAFWLRGRRIC
jgi:hypothetical protein